jgi:hypothetical protein
MHAKGRKEEIDVSHIRRQSTTALREAFIPKELRPLNKDSPLYTCIFSIFFKQHYIC